VIPGLVVLGEAAVKKVKIEGPIGVAALVGAVIGFFTGGWANAILAGAGLAVITMVVLSIYNAMAR
jgi:hypothetical protein